MKINDQELVMIVGGGISAALITAVTKVFTTIIEIGKMIGSSLRRGQTKNYC